MYKKVLMFFIVAGCMFSLRGGNVEAHLAGYTYSPTFRHIYSYDCLGHFSQIPSPDQHPATFQCVAVVTKLQVLCENPKNKKVTPGVPSGPYTLIGQSNFTDEDQIAEKTKGRADKSIRFADEGSPLLNACSERNRNWNTIDELIEEVTVTLKTYDCLDDACNDLGEQAYEAKLRCTVPINPDTNEPYSVLEPPPGDGTPTDYDCTLLAEAHCDKDGGCPITMEN